MLYDIREGGRRVYALALVQAIYRIHDGVGRNGMHFSPFLAFAAGCCERPLRCMLQCSACCTWQQQPACAAAGAA